MAIKNHGVTIEMRINAPIMTEEVLETIRNDSGVQPIREPHESIVKRDTNRPVCYPWYRYLCIEKP